MPKLKPTIKTITKILVDVEEHDSWSGPKIIDTVEFTSEIKAQKYVDKINGQNTDAVVPDYYVTAHIAKRYEAKVSK